VPFLFGSWPAAFGEIACATRSTFMLSSPLRFMVRWVAFGLCVGVGVMLVGGCGSKVKTVPVSGKVFLDGEPLTKGQVMFRADNKKGNQTQAIPSGDIDAQGNYELKTGNSKGAPPGWYRVSIMPLSSTETRQKGAAFPKPPYNSRFMRDDLTTLRVEVKEGAGADDYTLKLTAK